MLEYSFRLLGATLRSLHSPRLSTLDESVMSMRVWPSDVDSFGHMNNGRFLTLMDLGRNDLLVRSGALKVWLRRKVTPLVGGTTIRYKRSLRPFMKYQLRTRLVSWDEKWFYFEQRYTRGDDVYAVALVKALLQDPQGNVPPRELIEEIDIDSETPPIPDAVSHWYEAEKAMMGY